MKRRILQRSPDIALTLRMTKLSGQQPPPTAPAPADCPPVRILDHLGAEIEVVPAGGEYTVPECPPGGGGGEGCGEISGLFWRDDDGEFTESTYTWQLDGWSGMVSGWPMPPIPQSLELRLLGACGADVEWSWEADFIGNEYYPEASVADWPDYWTGRTWYDPVTGTGHGGARLPPGLIPSGASMIVMPFFDGAAAEGASYQLGLGEVRITATVGDQSWTAYLYLVQSSGCSSGCF